MWQAQMALRVRLGEARLSIWVEHIDTLFGGIPLTLSALPQISLQVLAAEALAIATPLIERASGKLLLIDGIEIGEQNVAGGTQFLLEDVASGRRSRGAVCSSGANEAAPLCFGWPHFESAIGGLPLCCRFVLGVVRLTRAEIDGIIPGDLLLINGSAQSRHELSVAVVLGGSERVWMRGVVKEDKIVMIGDASDTGQMQEAMQAASVADTTAVDIDSSLDHDVSRLGDVELALQFQLCEQVLSLSQIGTVAPGYVFRLQQPVSETTVGIRLNGQLIGGGILISLGDVLGVRVTHFLTR
ncbi:FliM/FliN family flagellar motor switch protein [Burkholderia diffusa]|uniref:FliM/FliN family flagellar motor switch protein n=1 Tax=Burkholderia diffusa TaxID=488732 RepID=UPI00075658F3|nr:FliM/FliN family flagellar motor switch protein [Burkholderia diffusa]KVN02929.1 hypothetical protein WJ62_12010 [Burkholderia diffusa]